MGYQNWAMYVFSICQIILFWLFQWYLCGYVLVTSLWKRCNLDIKLRMESSSSCNHYHRQYDCWLTMVRDCSFSLPSISFILSNITMECILWLPLFYFERSQILEKFGALPHTTCNSSVKIRQIKMRLYALTIVPCYSTV